MKSIISLLFSIPFLINSQQTLNKTITHDGGTREYIIHIPSSYDGTAEVPLLFCFHGYTSSAGTIMSYAGFNAKSDENNFIVVYPQGELLDGVTHWNVGGWTQSSTFDDVDFTDKLMDTIMTDYTIDASRVYSTGMSNGGYMSFLLACQLSDRIAAIASITGSMTPETYNACNPSHPTPVLQIHGTSDGTVPYNGNSSWTKSINDVLSYWTSNNNCTLDPKVSDIDDINQSDNSTVEYFKYNLCDDCANVEHYKVTGGDHDWPGVWGNMDIDATDLVWEFLSKHDINGMINCGMINTKEIQDPLKLNYYKSESTLTITGLKNELLPYHIFNIEGKKLSEGMLSNSKNTVDVSSYNNGLYLLIINSQTLRFTKE